MQRKKKIELQYSDHKHMYYLIEMASGKFLHVRGEIYPFKERIYLWNIQGTLKYLLHKNAIHIYKYIYIYIRELSPRIYLYQAAFYVNSFFLGLRYAIKNITFDIFFFIAMFGLK